jgi:acyl-CoA reductase-like NAD-dependent aldehyde dehydrogenase
MVKIDTQRVVTLEDLKARQEQLYSLRDAIEKRKNEIIDIEVNGGLTLACAVTDVIMFNREVEAAASEFHLLEGKVPREGKIGLCMPYDMPTLLLAFYGFPPFLVGMDCEIHLPSVMKNLETVWSDALEEAGIENMKIVKGMSGKEFGRYCIENPDVRHFVIAGSQQIVDVYTRPEIYSKFDTVFIFGPTRPKALFLEDANLNKYLKETVFNAFFNGGQICAVSKQFVGTKRNYSDLRDGMVQYVGDAAKEGNYGSPENWVGPIKDKPAFEKAKQLLKRFKIDSKYRILVGGKVYDKDQIIQPTLVEALDRIESDIDYFGPILILDEADNDDDAVSRVIEDEVHGGFVYIFTEDLPKALWYEGLLRPQCNMVRINGDIMKGSIGWPYGGYKKTFTYIKDGKVKHGVIFLSSELTE